MTTLLLVRHGETIDNVNKIMQGQTQGELTEKGREQAKELSNIISGRHIDAFVSSDLRRAVETCEIIASPHNIAVQTTALLRERDWGGFTGRYIPDLKDETWPDDIESIVNLKQRAGSFISYIVRTFPDKTVLAVGHGIINKAIQSVYYNKEMKDIAPMTNCEVREIVLSAI
ncbi:MAG: histidine phosphatase family protein [Prevotella sp.]